MVRRAKTPHSNIEKEKPAIKTYQEEYHNGFFSFRVKPVDEAYLEEFALQWVNWASEDENALKLTQFYNLKRIHNNTVEGWMKRSSILKEAHDLVLQMIGARREVGALTNKLDSAIVRTTMVMYEAKWKELEEWRENLKAKVAGDNVGFRLVELERFEDVPSVKPKKSV